jgi:hypothetical protein
MTPLKPTISPRTLMKPSGERSSTDCAKSAMGATVQKSVVANRKIILIQSSSGISADLTQDKNMQNGRN